MRPRLQRPFLALLLTASVAGAGSSSAQTQSDPAAVDDVVARARVFYARGVDLVQNAQWADALAAFERSAELRPHATTTFNVAACERALGRYARARATLLRALAASDAADGQMAPSLVTEAKGYVAEIEGLLARVAVRVDPPDAALAVDGRPLEVAKAGARPTLVAGTLPPGVGAAPPAASFDLVLDPGAHVFTITRKGYSDAVVHRTLPPGARESLDLTVARLPATLRITSTREGALVRVNDVDVGPVPVDVKRPAGAYRVRVEKEGFLPYGSQVSVRPGEEVVLRAALPLDEPSLTERWWFWAGAAAVVAGGVVLTYALMRPEEPPPPYDGGNRGWVVGASTIAW